MSLVQQVRKNFQSHLFHVDLHSMALRLRSKLVNFCIGFVCAHSVFSMFGHLSTQHENQIANSFVSSQIEQVDCIYIFSRKNGHIDDFTI